MNIKQRLRNYFEKLRGASFIQAQLFARNREDIARTNRKLLKSLLIIVMITMIGMLGVSFIVPSFIGLRIGYAVLLCAVLTIYLLIGRRDSFRAPLMGLYLYAVSALIFTGYISIFVFSQYNAVSIVCVFCLIPLLILDRPRRVNMFLLSAYAVFCTLSLLFKPYRVALEDIFTTACFLSVCLFMGDQMRKIRLENYELHRKSRIAERTDFLTGLPNRRKMYDALILSENPNRPNPFTGAMMVDIDMFKEYNDFYGHQAGDECLKKVGECFARFANSRELEFFRFGGEEFIVLCRGLSYADLAALAKEIHAAVSALQIANVHSPFGVVTVSIGYAQTEQNPVSGHEQLIRFADEALYLAKGRGRSTCCGYSECPADAEPHEPRYTC